MKRMTECAPSGANGAARPRYGGHGSFKHRLAAGMAGEEVVAAWLRNRGWTVVDLRSLPRLADFQGAHIFTPSGPVPTPDLLALRNREARLVEVKTKAGAGWHRRHSAWTTGISEADLARWIRASYATGTPVWLVLLHAVRSEGDEPVRLFGGDVQRLEGRIHHRHRGMVFWRVEDLPVLAALDELETAAGGAR